METQTSVTLDPSMQLLTRKSHSRDSIETLDGFSVFQEMGCRSSAPAAQNQCSPDLRCSANKGT